MKKILLYLFSIILLSACDTHSEIYDGLVSGYYTLRAEFVYPADSSTVYRTEFNGKSIERALFNKDETKGELKVFHKSSNSPELTVNYNLEDGAIVQLIKLPGQKVAIYEEGAFIKANFSLNLMGGYKAELNGQQIVNGSNYIRKENINGVIKYFKEGVAEPVYTSEPLQIETDKSLTILQSSDTEFLILTGGGELIDPKTRLSYKINFVWLPGTNFAKYDKVTLEIKSYDPALGAFYTDEEFPPIHIPLEKGTLTEYIELKDEDLTTHQKFGYVFNVYNENNNKIIDVEVDYASMFSFPTVETTNGNVFLDIPKYKFMTYAIGTDDWSKHRFVIGTEWETAEWPY